MSIKQYETKKVTILKQDLIDDLLSGIEPAITDPADIIEIGLGQASFIRVLRSESVVGSVSTQYEYEFLTQDLIDNILSESPYSLSCVVSDIKSIDNKDANNVEVIIYKEIV